MTELSESVDAWLSKLNVSDLTGRVTESLNQLFSQLFIFYGLEATVLTSEKG